MTSKERKALAAEAPQTDEEVALLVERLQQLQTAREAIVAKRDERRATLLAKLEQRFGYDARLAVLDVDLERDLVRLEAWADRNRKTRFTEKKSVEMGGACFGWKLGKWKTELAKRSTWKSVLDIILLKIKCGKDRNATKDERVDAALLEGFIRTTVEPDKEGMIANRDNLRAMDLLFTAGAQVVQEEGFFFKRQGEGQEASTLVAA